MSCPDHKECPPDDDLDPDDFFGEHTDALLAGLPPANTDNLRGEC